MGKTFLWTLATVFCMILFQATILANLWFLPVVPDLVLLVVMFVSFMNSAVMGSSLGFFSGLMLDFLSASPVGLNCAVKTVIGFVAGKFSGSINLDRVFLPAVMGAAGTLCKALFTGVLSIVFGREIATYSLFSSPFWLELAANTLSAPLIFALLGAFPTLYSDNPRNRE